MKYLAGVTSLKLSSHKCTGCGMCVEVCPRGVLEMDEGDAVAVDRDSCMECGACMNNCAFDAIWVDKGVGCASALINGMITGGEPVCGCGGGDKPAGGSCC